MSRLFFAALLLLPLLGTLPACSLTLSSGRATSSPSHLSAADRIAITDLIHRYSYTWDGRDTDGWVDLFTDDAVIQASFVGTLAWSYGSNAERRQFIDGFYEATTKDGLMRSRHIQTGTVLEPQADGSVRGETMFVVALQYKGEATPRFPNTGVYRDRFVRTPAGWKFALRDIVVDQE